MLIRARYFRWLKRFLKIEVKFIRLVFICLLMKEHHCAGTERTVQQSVESVRLNAAWLARDAQAVGEYLSSKSLPL